jgi:hypothetical protein
MRLGELISLLTIGFHGRFTALATPDHGPPLFSPAIISTLIQALGNNNNTRLDDHILDLIVTLRFYQLFEAIKSPLLPHP